MTKMLSAIKLGLGGVLRFNGRSSRTDFWIYAIFVVLLGTGLWSSVMSMEMSRTFGEVQRYADANPGKVTITTSSTSYSVKIKDGAPGVGPDFGYLMKWISAIAVVSVALLAAAAVRRLHDSDRTGLWVLLPLPFLFSAFWLMSLVFNDFNSTDERQMGLFALGFANNLVYMAALGFVSFLLLRSGTAGANRFGERDIEEAA